MAPDAATTGFERAARVEDLPEGTLLGVETTRGERICLVNSGGTIHAVSDTCTHQDFAMAEGLLVDDCTIECIWHGARFDLRTGAARKLPAEEPLPVYEVRVVDGWILVGARTKVSV